MDLGDLCSSRLASQPGELPTPKHTYAPLVLHNTSFSGSRLRCSLRGLIRVISFVQFGSPPGISVCMVVGDHRAEDAESHVATFATTHWSVVLAAGGPDSPKAARALETLCCTYWYPLYAYLRRDGHAPEDAEDLVQGFFLHLLQREVLKSIQREGGRFRSFLLVTLKHFVSDERARAEAKKRGGAHLVVSWDQVQAEQQFLREPVDIESPDRLFDRRWALILLERALGRLREESGMAGNGQRFAQLQAFVSGEKGELSYAEAAERAGLTHSALKSAVFRLRRRYHELIREEVSQTVAEPGEIEEELRYLLGLFSPG